MLIKRTLLESFLNEEISLEEFRVMAKTDLSRLSDMELCERLVSYEGGEGLNEEEKQAIQKCKQWIKERC